MVIVHVYVNVKAEEVQVFREATLENARNSVQEPRRHTRFVRTNVGPGLHLTVTVERPLETMVLFARVMPLTD